MTKLTLFDTGMEIVVKMSEGNPGAMSAILPLLQTNAGVGDVLLLDSLGIYGPRIWMLYKDVCKQDHVVMGRLLSLVRTGEVTGIQLDHAIDNYGAGLESIIAGMAEEDRPA